MLRVTFTLDFPPLPPPHFFNIAFGKIVTTFTPVVLRDVKPYSTEAVENSVHALICFCNLFSAVLLTLRGKTVNS